MEISNLLGKIKGGEKEAPPSFLALEITDEIVQAAVWQVIDGHTEVLAIGIPVEWDGDRGESNALVSAADATISSAVEGISQELTEVVFGLNSSWLEQEGILPAKRQLLKALSHDLELKPLGFVVVTDSLLRYLKMQEGTPTTAILIQVMSDTLTVMLLRFGKIETTVNLGRSDDVVVDLEEALSRFPTGENLPSRIIVFNSMHNLDEVVQNLLSYDWKNKFQFLHVPKIESLPKDVLIRSVAVAGGSEVAKSIGFSIEEQPTVQLEAPSSSPLTSADELGFMPVKKLPPQPDLTTPNNLPENQALPITEAVESPPPSPSPPTHKPKHPFRLPHLVLPKITLPKLSPLLTILSLSFISLILLSIIAIWLIPKATVTITVEPKILDENTSLTLSSTATSLDSEKSLVPANFVTKTVKGEDSLSTTGTETVGDQATGEVTIYNRTTLTKTFSAGTIFTADSLKFTLNDDVTVASSSSTVDSELKTISTPGKSDVKITASIIGEESNLPAGTEFTIANFSKETYLAKNTLSLSGGSSKTIQVVSQKDLDNLVSSLSTKLSAQAQQEIMSEIGDGKGVYLFQKDSQIISQTASSKVGDETDVINLSLELEAKGLSYSIADVEQLVASTLARAIPPAYARTSDPPTVELGDVISEGSDEVEAKAKIIVRLLPVLDIPFLRESLKGLPASEVEATLSNLVSFTSAEAEITPLWLPPRFKRMPRNPNNISITLQATQ